MSDVTTHPPIKYTTVKLGRVLLTSCSSHPDGVEFDIETDEGTVTIVAGPVDLAVVGADITAMLVSLRAEQAGR